MSDFKEDAQIDFAMENAFGIFGGGGHKNISHTLATIDFSSRGQLPEFKR